MRFIRRIAISVEDNTLRLYANTRKEPFVYHYDTKRWDLQKGDFGENITQAVLKYANASSMNEVVEEYRLKHYMEIYQAKLSHINSKSAIDIFTKSKDLKNDVNEMFLEPAMETINILKEIRDTKELEAEVHAAINKLYGTGSERMIKTAVEAYSAEEIDYEELNRVFYEYIDFLRAYDIKTAERLNKQIDIIYKQHAKRQ